MPSEECFCYRSGVGPLPKAEHSNLHPITDQIPARCFRNARHPTAMANLRFRQFFQRSLLLLASLGWVLGFTGCATHPETGVRKTSTTFSCVVLDAGHGGHDSGARSRKGVLVKDLTLDVIRRLAPKLRAAGLRTVLTRNSDVFIPLDRRVEISEREHSAVFLSVHFNDAGRRQVAGMESYYFSGESKRFSQRLVGALAEGTSAPNRGSREARFRVLRCNVNPAVLVECGYLSSRREAGLLEQPKYREKIATALAEAIIKQRGGPVRSPGQAPVIPQNAASLGGGSGAHSPLPAPGLAGSLRLQESASTHIPPGT
jgi:N-acetylmuramoyl-L-alanine amidase